MPEFRSYHEAAQREAQRRRQARTGIVSVLALIAIGVFCRDLPGIVAYIVGVVAVIVVGLIASRKGQ